MSETLMNFHLTLGYSGYFVLGYYFSKNELSKMNRKILAVITLVGFALIALLTRLFSEQSKTIYEAFFSNFSILVCFCSIGVFNFAKNSVIRNAKAILFVHFIAKHSFGAYLVHVLILEKILYYNLKVLTSFPAIITLAISLLVFYISIVISTIFSKVPIVGKYIT